MDKFERINDLLPFYIELLTDRQKEILEYYFYEDLSLSEIAENLKISRNGVYDVIKKCEVILEEYETKLNLFNNYCKRNEQYQRLKDLNNKEVDEIIDKLIKLED